MKAFILIQTEPGSDGQLASEVADLTGVKWVERVTGPYDLIAEAEWGEMGARSVVPRIQEMDGVLRALTSMTLGDSEAKGAPAPEPRVAASGA